MTLRPVRFILGYVPTAVTLAALAGVAWWGARTGWRLSIPSAAADLADDTPAIRVTPTPAGPTSGPPPTVRARIEFASADDVRRAGLGFAAARTQPLTRFVTATGSVGYDPAAYTQLSARAAGTVWWVVKVDGQSVADGETVAIVEAAEAGRAKADLLTGLRQLEQQTQALDRLRGVADAGAVPERTLLDARAAADDARTRVDAAQQTLLNLGLDFRYQDLQRVPVEDRFDRVQFLGLPADALPHVRGKTRSANLLPVTAPFAGVVVRRSVSRGEAVAPGKLLFVVAGVRHVHLELALDPADVRDVRVGQEVRFTPDADPEFEARGTLAHVVPEVDEATRKVWAHAEADNPDGRLRPNAFGRGRVVLAEIPAATVVPEEAVQADGAEFVAFVRDGVAAFQARRVRPGLRAGGLVQLDGVAAGEEVVTTGSHALLAEMKRDQIGSGGE